MRSKALMSLMFVTVKPEEFALRQRWTDCSVCVLLCWLRFRLYGSCCRTVERALGCDWRPALETLKERIMVALQQERLQTIRNSRET